jgi:hypothetical protein
MRRAFGQSDTPEQRQRLGGSIAGCVTRDAEGHLDVLSRRKLRQQVVKLEHETHVPVPEPHPRIVVHRPDVCVADANRSGIEGIESPEHVQQRALADAGRTDDGDHLTRLHGQGEIGKDGQRSRGTAVGLA